MAVRNEGSSGSGNGKAAGKSTDLVTLRGQVRWGRSSKEGTGVCSLATRWVAGTHRQGLRVMPGPSISPGGNFVKLRMLHCHLLEKCNTIYLNPRRLQRRMAPPGVKQPQPEPLPEAALSNMSDSGPLS